MEISTLHHVSIPVADTGRSRVFYRDVLGLREIERPPFDFDGAWFAVGAGQLHLIEDGGATFRAGKPLDPRDVHFAVRVPSFRAALEQLERLGYDPNAPADGPMAMKVSPHATAGFPQIYILDPDRNVIEINAERLDADL
jgi:glyoxylase I family protein